ncbi:MAG: FAD-dependent oxidoreductase [Acidimicrobiia bacterium]|nr:FAD-dependent oxidoreductase [Acidimicrobiia bacterium]
MSKRVVVVGGDAAGMSAASQARRRDPGLEIIVLEKGTRTSYSACGIPYHVSGAVDSLDDLVARTPQEFRDKYRIDARMRHEAMAVDLDRRRIEVRDHEHARTLVLGFDELVVATGARPMRPPIPGIDGERIFGVQTLDDAEVLLEHARTSRCRDVVVVGAGYIGLEMAEAFLAWGAKVTVVDTADQVMRTLDADMAVHVADTMRRRGIDVRLGEAVEAFEPGAVTTTAGSIPADLVILGMGVTPNSHLAGEAGVELGSRGAIRVDRRQRTPSQGVWAAGDCAESFHRVSQRWLHVALGTVANKQGRVLGVNLGGGYATFPGVVGTAITKVCETEVARTGLTEVEAVTAGFDHVAVTIETTSKAGYFPGARPMTVKMVAERDTGRLLGVQIVGGEGSAKRIDTAAVAITAEMSVADVIELDLAYAPPFSSVWDPIAVAAREAARAVDAGRDPLPAESPVRRAAPPAPRS